MLYQFYKGEEIVGTVGAPNWIILQKNGCYGLTTEIKAEGVAIEGTPYHLFGKKEIPNLETVTYKQITEEEFALQMLNEVATEEQIRIAIEEGVNSI